MAEAWINKATGEVVVVARKGWEWGRKEKGPDANPAFCIVELNDPDIDKFLEKYEYVVLPYRVMPVGEKDKGEKDKAEPPLEHKFVVPLAMRDGKTAVQKNDMTTNSKVDVAAKTLVTQGG